MLAREPSLRYVYFSLILSFSLPLLFDLAVSSCCSFVSHSLFLLAQLLMIKYVKICANLKSIVSEARYDVPVTCRLVATCFENGNRIYF